MSLILQTTTTATQVLQIDGLVTDKDKNYTLYTLGTVDAPSSLLCDDEAPAVNHIAPCQILPAPPPP